MVNGKTGGVGGIQGSLAQYAAVDAELLALKPANLTMREAAALPLAFITSYSGIVDRAHHGEIRREAARLAVNVRQGSTLDGSICLPQNSLLRR